MSQLSLAYRGGISVKDFLWAKLFEPKLTGGVHFNARLGLRITIIVFLCLHQCFLGLVEMLLVFSSHRDLLMTQCF